MEHSRSDLAKDTQARLGGALSSINVAANVRTDGFCVEVTLSSYHARMLAVWIEEMRDAAVEG